MAKLCTNKKDHLKFWEIQEGSNGARICYGSTIEINGQVATDVMPNLVILGYDIAGSMAILSDLSEMYMWDSGKNDWNKL